MLENLVIIGTSDINDIHNLIKNGSSNDEVTELTTQFMKRIMNSSVAFDTALGLAASQPNDNVELVKLLLENGADVNLLSGINQNLPTELAAINGNFKVLKELHSKGGEIVCKSVEGFDSSIHVLAFNGQIKCLQYLLLHGVDIESAGFNGRTPLLQASAGSLDVLEYLVNRGASVLAKDQDGWNALHYAAASGNAETINYLLDNHTLDVNSKTSDGDSPLHLACHFDNPAAAVALIKGGADIEALNEFGKTAYELMRNRLNLTTIKKEISKCKETPQVEELERLRIELNSALEACKKERYIRDKLEQKWKLDKEATEKRNQALEKELTELKNKLDWQPTDTASVISRTKENSTTRKRGTNDSLSCATTHTRDTNFERVVESGEIPRNENYLQPESIPIKRTKVSINTLPQNSTSSQELVSIKNQPIRVIVKGKSPTKNSKTLVSKSGQIREEKYSVKHSTPVSVHSTITSIEKSTTTPRNPDLISPNQVSFSLMWIDNEFKSYGGTLLFQKDKVQICNDDKSKLNLSTKETKIKMGKVNNAVYLILLSSVRGVSTKFQFIMQENVFASKLAVILENNLLKLKELK